MRLNKRSFGIIGLTLAFVAGGVAVGIFSAAGGQKLINILTAVGTYISLVAFGVMLQQFKSVRKTTENVKLEVNKIASIANLYQYAERVRTVNDDIHSHEYKLAAYKLESVQEALVYVKSTMTDAKKIQQYTKVISAVSTIKTSLQEKDVSEESLNLNKIHKDMEKVINFLLEEKNEIVK